MKKLLLFLLFAFPVSAQTVTVTGNIRTSTGAPFNGRVVLELPVSASYLPSPAAVVPVRVSIRILNGSVVPTKVYGNDVLSPAGTYYRATFIDSFGVSVSQNNYIIGGGTFDFGTAVPTIVTTSNISLASPVGAGNNNTFTGTNIFTGITRVSRLQGMCFVGESPYPAIGNAFSDPACYKIYVPEGTYALGLTGLTLDRSNVRVEWSPGVIITYTGTDCPLTFGGVGAITENMSSHGSPIIRGNSGAVCGARVRRVRFSRFDVPLIEDFVGASSWAIILDPTGGTSGEPSHNRFYGSGKIYSATGVKNGILFEAGGTGGPNDNEFIGVSVVANVGGGKAVWMKDGNNKIIGGSYGATTGTAFDIDTDFNTIIAVRVESSTNGFDIDAGSTNNFLSPQAFDSVTNPWVGASSDNIIIDPSRTEGRLFARQIKATVGHNLGLLSNDGIARVNVGTASVDMPTSIPFIFSGGMAVPSATPHIAHTQLTYKAADETVSNSTVVQDDDHLSVTLAASSRYRFRFYLFFNIATAAQGLRSTISGTAGVTNVRINASSWDSTGSIQTTVYTSFGSEFTPTSVVGDWVTIHEGTIETSTAGTVKLQWAQASSNATAVTVRRGSYLEVVKLP